MSRCFSCRRTLVLRAALAAACLVLATGACVEVAAWKGIVPGDAHGLVAAALAEPVPAALEVLAHETRIRREGTHLRARMRAAVRLPAAFEVFPLYARAGAACRAWLVTDRDTAPRPLAIGPATRRGGRLARLVATGDAPPGAVLVIEREETTPDRGLLLLDFLPDAGAGVRAARLDVDVGRPLAAAFVDGLERRAGTRDADIDGTRLVARFALGPLTDGNRAEPGAGRLVVAAPGTGLEARLAAGWSVSAADAARQAVTAAALVAGFTDPLDKVAALFTHAMADAASLAPGFVPGAAGAAGDNAGEGAADALRTLAEQCAAAGLPARVVIPLAARTRYAGPAFAVPYLVPGLLVRAGTNECWLFPTSRYAAPNHVPAALRGLPCLLIDAEGKTTTGTIPARPAGTDHVKLWLTGSLGADGSFQYAGTAAFGGEMAERCRELLAAEPGTDPRARFAALFFPLSAGASVRGFEPRHEQAPHLPLTVAFSGRLPAAALRTGRLLRFPAAWSAAAGLLPAGPALVAGARAWGRRASVYEYVSVNVPHGTIFHVVPREVRHDDTAGTYVRTWKRVPGVPITKPAHWAWATWQSWLRWNTARTADTLVAERYFLAKRDVYTAGEGGFAALAGAVARGEDLHFLLEPK